MSAVHASPAPGEVPGAEQPLLGCLHIITRLHGHPVSAIALAAGTGTSGSFSTEDFLRAAREHGYSAQLVRRSLAKISHLLLPATLLLKDGGACVLTHIRDGKVAGIVVPESGLGARELPLSELQRDYTGFAIFAHPELRIDHARDGHETSAVRRRSWFWGTLVAYAPYYVEAIVAGLAINVLTVATALFSMNVYDRVVPNNAEETLIVLAIGTALAAGFEFVARSLRAYFLDVAGKKADFVLGSLVFAQALGLPLAKRPQSAGTFAAQLREFESVRDFITSITLTSLMDVPFVAFFLWVVYMIGGPLFLVPTAAVPAVLIVGLLAQFPLAHSTKSNMIEVNQRHGLLIEALEGVEMLKAMRAEGAIQRRHEEHTALASNSANHARLISSVVVHFSVLVQQAVTIGMVVWGVFLIGKGELTTGGLVACVMLAGRGLGPLTQIAGLMMRYQHARTAYFTLDRLMSETVERPAGARYTHRERVRGAIALRGVYFRYPRAAVDSLIDVSFSIAAGEHVAILGKVGSGKSTLLRLMIGLYPPREGTVLVDGADIAQFDPADLRYHIGYVAQDPALVHGTLRDNIVIGRPHADDAAVLRAAAIAGLDDFIAGHAAGLQLPVGERGDGLSGGQRQAVANARACLVEPAILLLDEPTSAMDHTTEQRYIGRMAEFSRGRTLVLVTHKPSMLQLVSRIIIVDGGRVVADGPRDDVLRQLTQPVAGASR